MKTKYGFSLISIIIIIAVILAVCGIGYIAYDRLIANNSTDGITEQTITIKDLPSTPEIDNTTDLDSAVSTLDSVDLDSSSQTNLDQLQTELDSF